MNLNLFHMYFYCQMLSNIVTHGPLFGNIDQCYQILLNITNIAQYYQILFNITKYYRGYMDMNFDNILYGVLR